MSKQKPISPKQLEQIRQALGADSVTPLKSQSRGTFGAYAALQEVREIQKQEYNSSTPDDLVPFRLKGLSKDLRAAAHAARRRDNEILRQADSAREQKDRNKADAFVRLSEVAARMETAAHLGENEVLLFPEVFSDELEFRLDKPVGFREECVVEHIMVRTLVAAGYEVAFVAQNNKGNIYWRVYVSF